MMTSEQKRHWVSTVWPKHIGYDDLDDEAELISAFTDFWKELSEAPGLKYGIAQIERSPDTGKLHIQAYTEWAESKRLSEVYKILPSNLDFRRGTRDVARQYCRKTDTRLLVLPELGVWRKEKAPTFSPKQRALSYLREGLSPSEICSMDPECYFTHWRAIREVSQSLKMKPLLTVDPTSGHGEEELHSDEEK